MKTHRTILLSAMVFVLVVCSLPCNGKGKAKGNIWCDKKAEWRRDCPKLTDEKIGRVMARLTESEPEKAKELAKLREQNPEKFKAEIKRIVCERFCKGQKRANLQGAHVRAENTAVMVTVKAAMAVTVVPGTAMAVAVLAEAVVAGRQEWTLNISNG